MRRWAGVARFGGIGDNLISASVLPVLKRMGYATEVITEEPNHVVFQHNPHIDKLSIKRQGEIPKADLKVWQQWIESRGREFDLFLHGSHSCEGRHATFPMMSSFWWPERYRRQLCGGSYLETVHDIIGVPHEFGPLYYTSPEEREHAAAVKAKVGPRCITWVLCGTRIDKVYPYTTMAVARIIKEIGAPVVVMGGGSDKEYAMAHEVLEHVKRQNGTREGLHLAIPAVAGEKAWPLRTSLAFLHATDLVITPDTGPAWACAFEPMPKLVMVSHASAENITKHWRNTTTLHADPQRVSCWPCHRLHDDKTTCRANQEDNGAACISDISVERIVSATAAIWKATDPLLPVARQA